MKKALVIFFLLQTLVAYAIDLELTHGLIKKIPIAMLGHNDSNNTTSEELLQSTIYDDLNLTDKFSWVTFNSENPNKDINYNKLQASGANYLIKTKLSPLANGKYFVSFSLNTPLSNNHILLRKDYQINKQDLVSLAHHISDRLYHYITGERGVFSTKLAYISIDSPKKPRRYTLRIADYNGKNSEVLLTSSEPIMSPSWSPNGKELAYVSFENHKAEIYTINIQNGERQLLTSFPGINGAPSWSPSGKSLAIVLSKDGSPNLYLIGRDGENLVQLTKGGHIDTEPSFSRDGKFIYFTSNRGGAPQIYKINIATRAINRVTFEGNYNAHAKLTSNERELIVMHRRGKRFSIAKQSLVNSELLPLTFKGQNESPSLSPNDRFVIYANKNKEGKQSLKIVSLDSLNQHTISPAGKNIQEPSWSPYLTG